MAAVLTMAASGQTSPAPNGQTQSSKPPLTLDEFFNYTGVADVALAPDGSKAVIGTERAAWKQNRFREDLWMWHASDNSVTPLTSTGHDSDATFSSDGKYIAFRSNRPIIAEGETDKNAVERIWILAVSGGEAFPLYSEPLSVDAYTWSGDGSSIFVATEQPISKDAKEAETDQWKDTVQWRNQRRGDEILRIAVASAVPSGNSMLASAVKGEAAEAGKVPLPANATVVAKSPLAIEQLAASPDGTSVAFRSRSVLNRQETPADYEIFLVPANGTDATPRQLTHNQGYESSLKWSHDSKTLYFAVSAAEGSAEQAYQDVQGRVYAMNVATGAVHRLGSDYQGSWEDYAVASDGNLLAVGESGTEMQVYGVHGAAASKMPGVAGTYGNLTTARKSPRLLVVHSAIDEPAEVYVADDAAHLTSAKRITHFNKLFTERALPQWKTYQWKSDDGTTIEGMLLYPPGKLGQKHLRMFTFIHGGPAGTDGNRFGADWYDWGILAADNNWLVFRPNYRGSSGYGDKFELAISPEIVSLPGKDILSGVDKLVADGIADPDHLAIGGYSYGGYMTNWLITQTTRFRSAVTGAGAVEHAANWGNDDMSYDDAWMLGGTPWQAPSRYQSEAALFQFDKVKTPTHAVVGGADIRVAHAEGYLLERALQTMNVPHVLLVFPGEGHGLANDPWHGYIKVRDELQWLEKYDHSGK